MIDPRPLFEDDDFGTPQARPGVVVGRLDLGDEPPPAPAPSRVVSAIGDGDHAGLAQAMARGAARFPAIMQNAGFLVRNNLNQLLPLDFDKLANFGAGTLERAAAAMGEVATLNGRLAEIDAESILLRVVEAARAHGARKRQASLLGLLANFAPFDAHAAARQVAGLHHALLLRVDQVSAAADALERLQGTLSVEVTTLAILEDMSDHGAMGDMLSRRAALFQASLQEVAMALAQLESLRRQVQEWTMRCDEVLAVTLPALGYTASL